MARRQRHNRYGGTCGDDRGLRVRHGLSQHSLTQHWGPTYLRTSEFPVHKLGFRSACDFLTGHSPGDFVTEHSPCDFVNDRHRHHWHLGNDYLDYESGFDIASRVWDHHSLRVAFNRKRLASHIAFRVADRLNSRNDL